MSNNDGNGWPPSQGGGQGQQDPQQQGQGYGPGPAGPTDAHRLGGSFGESWREQEFGHGQERYYGDSVPQAPQQQYGQTPVEYGSPPSGPIGGVGGSGGGGRRTAIIAAGAVAAVAVLGGGGFAIYKGTQGDKPAPGAQSSTSQPVSPTSSAPSPTSEASPSSSGSDGGIGTKNVPPIVPGWKVNYASKDGKYAFNAAFDVPAGTYKQGAEQKTLPLWDVSDEVTTLSGYGDDVTPGAPLAFGRKPATYREDYCPQDKGSEMANIVFQVSGDRDPVDIAGDATTRWAKALAIKKDKKTFEKYTEGTPTQIKVNGGNTEAVQTRTTIPNTEPDPKKCSAPKVELVVTSFTSVNATATIVAVRKLGLPNALDNATWEKILASARPVEP